MARLRRRAAAGPYADTRRADRKDAEERRRVVLGDHRNRFSGLGVARIPGARPEVASTLQLPASGFRPPSYTHPVLTRFAPAPTGWLHVGHVLNAEYVWTSGGRVILRIEDHDRERCRPEYEAG